MTSSSYVEDPWAEEPSDIPATPGGEQIVSIEPGQDPQPVLSGAQYEEPDWALGNEPDPVVPFDQQPVEDQKRDVVALIADDSGQAVALFRDPDEVQRMTRSLSGALVEQVRSVYAQARAPRVAKYGEKEPPTDVHVAEELRTMADARDTLTAIAKAIGTGAEEARAIAREILAEVAPDERKAKTVRLADGHGWDLKVTRSQPTEAVVNLDDVQDVLAGSLLARYSRDMDDTLAGQRAYAHGIRAGMDALLGVLSKPGVRTTALDALVRTLEGEGEEDLALRLRHAYGRKAKGEPVVDLKREEPKGSTSTGG